MKLLKKSWLGLIIEYVLVALIVFATILTLTLYWSIPYFTDVQPNQPNLRFEKYFIVLLVSGVMSILILWQARCVMRIINRGDPFILEMVRRLRLIGVMCLFLSVFYFISIFFVTRFFMVAVFITFLVVGMIIFVLAELFRQAIVYKEENDMTI